MAGDAGYGTAPDHAAPWVSAPGATDPGVLVGPDTLDIPSPTTSGAGCAPLAAPKSGGWQRRSRSRRQALPPRTGSRPPARN